MAQTKKILKILEAHWSKKEAQVDEKVGIEIVIQNAEGRTAVIQIYEYRKKNRVMKEIKVPVKESKAIASWKVEYVPDIYGEEPPEYRFKVSIGKQFKTSKTLYLKAEIVNIALTFDDGPHAAEFRNRTEKVLDVLRRKNIKAVFFIQTHAPLRANTSVGQKLIQRMVKEGHIVGIHTGSLEDHVDHALRVAQRPVDVDGDGKVDGRNGLESDLIRAKALIKKLTEYVPKFVRAPYGRYKADKEIIPTYRRQKLIHVLWDIDSLDNVRVEGRKRFPGEVEKALRDSFRALRFNEAIVLFHDLNLSTAEKIEDYINAIVKTIAGSKKIPKFTTRTRELRALLERKGVG